MRLLPYGPGAVLAEYDDLDTVLAVAQRVRDLALPGVVEVVPAMRTVLVVFDGPVALDGTDGRAVEAALSDTSPVPQPPGPLVTVPVAYDGADLTEVVALHCSAEYRVAFCGFMPGFAYLLGLPTELHLPRRSTPRTRVPAGSVAIAAEFSSVYPSASPGGWHLLGTTDLVLWDESLPAPAVLVPGIRVRFEAR